MIQYFDVQVTPWSIAFLVFSVIPVDVGQALLMTSSDLVDVGPVDWLVVMLGPTKETPARPKLQAHPVLISQSHSRTELYKC